jgi:hypothetical protein
MTWPFLNAPNELTVTAAEVTRGERPVLFASHYPDDGGWALLHGGQFSMDAAQLVTLKSLVDADPSLKALADLPLGWSARRTEVGGEWSRYEDPGLRDEG